MMNINDLLVPLYPQLHLHEQQVQSLQQLPERAEQTRLLRVGNAAYHYHQLADG